MGKIKVLPDTLCNQIAAGEVVERPAAVVKELVENSIDAGSRKIAVALLQGGRKEIRVVDNGTGMTQEDALLAIERHATSKLSTVEDLQSIRSLGFRGEALPSIAAVSRFELVTREPDAVSGVIVRVEGGVLRDVREAGCPAGTMITVRDLFHNLPARRKFLRSVDTEMAHISDQFVRLAMAHPSIHFQLSHQEHQQHDFPQSKTALGRAGQILGTELMARLRPFESEIPSLRLHGLLSAPDLQRSNGQAVFAYVNGRPVWDRTLNHAILSAYESLLPKGKFPVVVLFLDLGPDLVDVNVHPTKREVRFRNPGEVIEAVRSTLRKALEQSPLRGGGVGGDRPSYAPGSPSAFRNPFTRETQTVMPNGREEAFRPKEASPYAQLKSFVEPPSSAQHEFPGGDFSATPPPEGENLLFSHLPVIGQLANAFILLEAPDGLVLIDQHAAHERILFDRLTASAPSEGRQRLTRSVVLELFPKEAATLRRWCGYLNGAGFEIEPFGGNSFTIQAVPAVLSDYAPDLLIRELLQTAHEEEKTPQWDLVATLAKTAACHAAIKAGQKLRIEEIRHLLDELDRTRVGSTCPHGRPLWFKLTYAEITRSFHRT